MFDFLDCKNNPRGMGCWPIGDGPSERLLGQALTDRADAFVVTKFGIGIDEQTRQLSSREPWSKSKESRALWRTNLFRIPS